MKIRKAEPRDISTIEYLFRKLLDYLQRHGQNSYSKDVRKFRNGIHDFLDWKVRHEDSLVLVTVNDEDEATGFLIGGLRQLEPFFEYVMLAEIQWVYPFNTSVRQMEKEFERWGMEKGAQAVSNFGTPGNIRVEKSFFHEGREKVWHYYIKPLER